MLHISGDPANFNPSEWKFFWAIQHDKSWLVRRVDRIQQLNRGSIETKMSFMLDLRKIRELMKESGYDPEKCPIVPVPLFSRKREPILDVDVCDERGRSLSVATADVNTRIAQMAVLHAAREYCGLSDRDRYFARFSQDLYRCLYSGTLSVYNEVQTKMDGIDTSRMSDEPQLLRHHEAEIIEYSTYWDSITSCIPYELMSNLRGHLFVVYLELSPQSDFTIIKCRLEAPMPRNAGSMSVADGEMVYQLDCNALSEIISRSHVRYIAPEGFRISELYAIADVDQAKKIPDLEELINDKSSLVPVRASATHEKVEIHKRGGGQASAVLYIKLLPRRMDFISPAAVFLTIFFSASFILLAILSYYAFVGYKIPPGVAASSGATGAVMALAGARLARVSEHDIASQFYAPMRWRLARCIILLLVINAQLPFPYDPVFKIPLTFLSTIIFFIAGLKMWRGFWAIKKKLSRGIIVNGVVIPTSFTF